MKINDWNLIQLMYMLQTLHIGLCVWEEITIINPLLIVNDNELAREFETDSDKQNGKTFFIYIVVFIKLIFINPYFIFGT